MNQDAGTYPLNRADGHFPAPADHPVLRDVDSFDGEGVNPIVFNAQAVPGVHLTRVAKAQA